MPFFKSAKDRSAKDVALEQKERTDFINPHKVKNPSVHGNPPNLSDIKILYDGGDDGFALAVGTWNQPEVGIIDDEMLLMRWNGKGDTKGFPFNADNPFWFPIPKIFVEDILSTLRWWIEEENKDITKIAKYFEFEPILSENKT